MRTCPCCQRTLEITAASRPRAHVYEDSQGPFMYLLHLECSCNSTLSLVLWQDEDCTAAELEEDTAEAAGAELYARDEAPLDRATYRPFFSLTHELADRGL